MPSNPSQRPPPEGAPPAEPESEGQDPERDAHGPYRDPEGRLPLERILPELIRRGLEAGRGPLGKVSESIFPRDIAANVAAQLGDIRSGVVRAVAQEVGRFLRDADIASEIRKVLIGLDVEAQVRLRFNARKDGGISPDVDVRIGDATTQQTSGQQASSASKSSSKPPPGSPRR